MSLIAFQNCDLSRPSVDSSSSVVSFTHTASLTTCVSCHSTDRPAPVSDVLHGNNADCVACHTASNDLSVSLTAAFQAGSSAYTHTTGLTSCQNCHAPNRPDPINNFPHFNNQDCASCHSPGSNNTDGLTFTQVTDAFFNSAAYTHPSGITNCSVCHAPLRPTPAQDPTHDQTQDCVACHATSDAWTQSTTAAQIQNLWSSGATP